jgi:hypothetical protein
MLRKSAAVMPAMMWQRSRSGLLVNTAGLSLPMGARGLCMRSFARMQCCCLPCSVAAYHISTARALAASPGLENGHGLPHCTMMPSGARKHSAKVSAADNADVLCCAVLCCVPCGNLCGV